MLRRVVRVELKVFVSVCGFHVDASFYSSIKFTVEEGKDGSIAFLDTMTTRNPDGTIKTN